MATDSAVIYDNNPIDCDELLERCMGNSALVRRILQKFLNQVGVDVNSLVSAIGRQDVTEAIRIAHKVRGTSLSVSAIEMARLAHAIEMLAESASTADLFALATDLSNEQIKIVSFLDSNCIVAKDA